MRILPFLMFSTKFTGPKNTLCGKNKGVDKQTLTIYPHHSEGILQQQPFIIYKYKEEIESHVQILRPLSRKSEF